MLMALLFFVAAALYASVGHAGASGYLAVMALFGVGAQVMKPTALILNILVAAVGSFRFYRAGLFSWRLFWPFAITSIPMAFAGGALDLSAGVYERAVGAILLYAAVWMFRSSGRMSGVTVTSPPLWMALFAGALIGFVSGLTGVGGGIFLSPLLLMMGWAETRQASAVAAVFILVNSSAGLLGHMPNISILPASLPVWGAAVLAGGLVGSHFGSAGLAPIQLRKLLSVVLVVAGLKLLLS